MFSTQNIKRRWRRARKTSQRLCRGTLFASIWCVAPSTSVCRSRRRHAYVIFILHVLFETQPFRVEVPPTYCVPRALRSEANIPTALDPTNALLNLTVTNSGSCQQMIRVSEVILCARPARAFMTTLVQTTPLEFLQTPRHTLIHRIEKNQICKGTHPIEFFWPC